MKRRFAVGIVLLFAASCVFRSGEDQECTQYCDLMEENCDTASFLDDDGDFDRDSCLLACAGYDRIDSGVPLGDPVADSDSLECRTYHANNAAGEKNGPHCGHAGKDGAMKCVQFKQPCDEYCSGARNENFGGVLEFCISTDVGFKTLAECTAFCNSIPEGDKSDTTGNTRHCYLNAAIAASEADDTGLCAAATEGSEVCVPPMMTP